MIDGMQRIPDRMERKTQTMWMVFDPEGAPYTVGATEFEAWYIAESRMIGGQRFLEEGGFICRQVEVTLC